MAAEIPWQPSAVPGPRQAHILAPEMCGKLMKAAKRPIVIVGGDVDRTTPRNLDLVKYVIGLADALRAPLVVSPGRFAAFNAAAPGRAVCMGLEEVVQRLSDTEWQGFDGQGGYDLAVFMGGVYYFQNLMLSALKGFAPKVRTVSLDRFYHPNAGFSFPNLTEERWVESLQVVAKTVGGR
ncbi:MAG: CO dehydrogenase/acetyl-CoA synthase complex subunit epsilon [Candidatus Bathyarchaeia archaeon]